MTRFLGILLMAPALAAAQEIIPIPAAFKPDPLKKAEAAFERGDWPRAAEHASSALDGLLDPGPQARAYWLLGKSQEALGEPAKGLSLYQVATRIHPRDVPLLLAQADLFVRVDLRDRALPLYKAALKIESDSYDARLGLARSNLEAGLLAAAEEDFRALLKRRPEDLVAVRGLSAALTGLGRYGDAEAVLAKALEGRDAAGLWEALADVQWRAGKTAAGAASLENALKAEPLRPELRLRLAFWRFAEGRWDLGEKAAREVHEADPADPLARLALALARSRRGDPAASADLKAAADQTDHPFVRQVALQLLGAAGGQP